MANTPDTPAILWKTVGEKWSILDNILEQNLQWNDGAGLVSGNTHKEMRELNYLAGNQDGGRRGALPCKPWWICKRWE